MIYTFEQLNIVKPIENHLNLGGTSLNDDTICINSKYFVKNGQPWIPVMGEIHFSRISQEHWETEILKMKAGGITLISTYIIWIYHNEIENKWDFNGDNNIRKFVLLCQKHSMDVVLRVGPWCHGEARNGGFPDWLLEKKIKVRCNDETYLAYAAELYKKIADEVSGLFFKDGGNIVAVQLENELVDNAEHLMTLKKLAQSVGLDAPIYTVTGWNSKYGAKIPENEVVPVFGGYPEAPWTGHNHRLSPNSHYFFLHMRNDSAIGTDLITSVADDDPADQIQYDLYPFATCELGGGIQVTHHRRPIIRGDDVAAISHIKLACGNNLPGYYMYHGGTNKIGTLSAFNESKATGYPNDYPIRSYDFQAAIGEFGLIRPQYRLFKLQHLFINDFMDIFAPMESVLQSEAITNRSDTESLRYGMRFNGYNGFIFVNNYQRITDMPCHESVQFSVDCGKDKLLLPPITVKSNSYFFFPIHMDLSGTDLIYATVQPLCRIDTTYFFFEIDGIPCEYTFLNYTKTVTPGFDSAFSINDITIVTLTKKQAEYTYKFGQLLFIGNTDMYLNGNCLTVYSTETNNLSYHQWQDGKLIAHEVIMPKKSANVAFHEIKDFTPYHAEELSFGKKKKIQSWEINTEAEDGFISIDYIGDCAQIYIDGTLMYDDFYYGKTWTVPVEKFKNGSVILTISELNDELYLETTRTKGLELCAIDYIPYYENCVLID